ncbi:30S ribosomal protein S9 [Patescibacteria group bacterium]
MPEKKATKKKEDKKEEYFEAVGRRKSAIARVRIFPKHKDKGEILVNEKELSVYLPQKELQEIIKIPFKKAGLKEKDFYISIKVYGGGIRAQADAIRLGISRALLKINPDFRPTLKAEGFLTRDARVKERRKFGLKKARKAPQWSKR